MTKAMAANVDDMAAVEQADRRPHAEGHGDRHRRAVPQGRGEVLQGSRRDVADARSARHRGGAAAPFRIDAPPTEHPVIVATRSAGDRAADAALRVAGRRHRGRDVAVPHVRRRLRAAGGDDLPRHAPAVRADARLPAVSRSRPAAAPAGASLDRLLLVGSAGPSSCTSSSTTSTSPTASSTSTT